MQLYFPYVIGYSQNMDNHIDIRTTNVCELMRIVATQSHTLYTCIYTCSMWVGAVVEMLPLHGRLERWAHGGDPPVRGADCLEWETITYLSPDTPPPPPTTTSPPTPGGTASLKVGTNCEIAPLLFGTVHSSIFVLIPPPIFEFHKIKTKHSQ